MTRGDVRAACLALLLAACHAARVPPDLGTERDVPAAGGEEAPAGFDGASNGLVAPAVHEADREEFDAVETASDGLGPLYNAQACRECHQNPLSGGGSQVTELRAGHRGPQGRFEPPRVPIARGSAFVEGRTLINDRALCPSGAFPDQEIQERVPDGAELRALRLSLPLLGDGFVEAVADEDLRAYAERQCRETHGRICGVAIEVPVLEAPGSNGVGRFGWKGQHASLLSFSADAYLNEMGITSRLMPEEVTALCDAVEDPEDAAEPAADGGALADIDRFARFVRATKAPARDARLAETEAARRGSEVFDRIGCAACHRRNVATAPAGTRLHGGAYEVPAALGGRLFHPFGDFLLHDVGTGDGIPIAVAEHHGRAYLAMQERMEPTAPRLRTAPLWGLRLRSRLMHDGASLGVRDAIRRHAGEASDARERFDASGAADQEALVAFLGSL